ncbi:MAG TPA: DUF4147 domain-containing protein [Gammaproteobacteria bacterium]|nr:DUF4147 domain-containing protein [Gammaproteobacteria bacterium]
MPEHREDLLAIYRAALAAVEGRVAVSSFLHEHDLQGSVYVVAIGKAAASMARGAHEQLGQRIAAGLVVTRHGYGQGIDRACPHFRLIEAGHPVPDDRSLEAGRQLLSFLQRVPDDGVLLFLISGGASSLVEVLPEGVTLSDLQRANDWLLGSGLSIARVNAVRRALSRIKGGRLVEFLTDRPVWNLLISDVPGDDPAVIGSGLLVTGVREPLPEGLPPWLARLVKGKAYVPDTKSRSHSIRTAIVACSSMAREAAAREARKRGYAVSLHECDITGDVSDVAREMASCLLSSPRTLHVWGGEPTMHLPDIPGLGGRCQHLALCVAHKLQSFGLESYCFLAAGTDGSDGPGDRAGALVDGGTLLRGQDAGLDAAACLRGADAGRYLQAAGDLLRTGVTGTNVMDLMLGVRLPRETE